MKKSKKTSGILASAFALTSMFGLSAFADSRHQDETWRHERDRGSDSRRDDDRRDGRRRDDRDFVSGVVERVDRHRGVVMLRERRGSRGVAVKMVRQRGHRAGVDIDDLRRGDAVTFVGDWSRGGVFEAWRIDSVDSRRGGRNR